MERRVNSELAREPVLRFFAQAVKVEWYGTEIEQLDWVTGESGWNGW